MNERKENKKSQIRQITILMALVILGLRIPLNPSKIQVATKVSRYQLQPETLSELESKPEKKLPVIKPVQAITLQVEKKELKPQNLVEMIPAEEPDEYEVELLAHLIFAEAGNQSDECQLATGTVVLNRVKSERYPNSIEEVIYDEGQYECTWDGNFEKEPSQQARDNAYRLLKNEIKNQPEQILPSNVIYQSSFEQGSGVYAIIGTQYFCYE